MRIVCLVLAWCLLPASEVAAQGTEDARSEGVQIANPCGLRLDGDPPLFVFDESLVDWNGPRLNSPRFASPNDVLGVRVLEAAEAQRRFGSAVRRGVVEITLRNPPLRPAPSRAAAPSAVAVGTSVVLRAGPTGPTRAEVFDAEGCRVLDATSELGASTLSVPTSGLAPGAYVVRVSGAGGVVRRIVTVQ